MKHVKSWLAGPCPLALCALFACHSQTVPPPSTAQAPVARPERAETAKAPAQVPEKPGQHPKTASIRSELKYLIHLPTGYPERAARYPLIVFLHGSGERGDDLEIVKKHGIAKVA
ncbi:MAG TPA: hypothetical protein VGP93_03715, partial [Polyangiaceae bacterium]|nr:hypothetical protein [Polyangiaceae bacterium]